MRRHSSGWPTTAFANGHSKHRRTAFPFPSCSSQTPPTDAAGRRGGLGPSLLQLAPGPIVRTQVRAGLGVMPSFSHEEISTEEMNDLIAYVRASRLSGPPYRPLR